LAHCAKATASLASGTDGLAGTASAEFHATTVVTAAAANDLNLIEYPKSNRLI
jgi:hypothetical protein